jgi:hypothetical protein
MATEYSPQIVTNGLVLYLDAANPRSYVSGSTSWYSLIVNTASGSLINGPTYSSSSLGNIVLDGIDDYITQNYYTATNFVDNQSWTIDVVVNVVSSESAGNTRGGILTNQLFSAETNPGGFGLNILSQTYCVNLTSGSTGNAVSYQFIAQTAINYNTIERITAVWDSSTSTVSIYRNGVLANSSTSALYKWSTRTSGTLQYIGTSSQGGWSYYFPMRLYTVSLYNRALSQTEISQNFNATRNRYGI